MKESVEYEKKQKQHWFSYFQIASKYLKSFTTDLLNIIFDDFSIWLLGYRIEFSCLYLPQGHTFISIVWLGSTDKYVMFLFWVKVHL
mgnify:CR=1 FL=1